MKKPRSTKLVKGLLIIILLVLILLITVLISINLIIDPIIYWLASTEIARLFIACVFSWFTISQLFELFYKFYKSRNKSKRFNALNVPYPRQFKGRKD